MAPKRPRNGAETTTKKKPTTTKRKQARQPSSSDDDTPQRNVLALVDTLASEESVSGSSPEPDMILAEITTTVSAIPHDLVHKILQSFFGEETKISKDARDLVTEYIEMFVKEAVARSNLERVERDGAERGGFLEVGDLEKVAAVLALDF